MLDFVTIKAIAKKVAAHQVADSGVERILTEAAIDSEGNDVLRITLVLKPEAANALTGDAALDLLVELQRELGAEGEERIPIVEYATEEELKLDEEQQESSTDEDEAEDES